MKIKYIVIPIIFLIALTFSMKFLFFGVGKITKNGLTNGEVLYITSYNSYDSGSLFSYKGESYYCSWAGSESDDKCIELKERISSKIKIIYTELNQL